MQLPIDQLLGHCPECLLELGLSVPGETLPEEGEFREDQVEVDAVPGTVIGRYKLLEQIGAGGFGLVFMAEQTEPVHRKVALKVIKAGMDTREVIARFEAERQALALMDHPNIARVFDCGATESGRPYFVMELVNGLPVTEYCDRERLSTEQRLELFIKICHAVQHAHQKGIIHRDLKPRNILVTVVDGQPVPKVIDFGVAKALGQRLTEKTLFTAFQQIIGTPAYMSPEQAGLSGVDVDTRSDIYSLGVVLYVLLTGAAPFEADIYKKAALDEVRRIIREVDPPKPSTRLKTLGPKLIDVAKCHRADAATLPRSLEGDLDCIVMKCLEKERTRRYETPNDMALDIARFLGNEPVVARPPSVAYRLQKTARRHKFAFAASGAFLVLLIATTAVSYWQAVVATSAKYEADSARATADTAKGEAMAEARRANAKEVEARNALAASDFLQAIRYISEDKDNDAVAHLIRRLRVSPSHEAAAVRLATLLTYRSWCEPIGEPLKHSQHLTSAQFSPNGKCIVTTSEDRTARLWKADTGRPLSEPLKHSDQVHFAEFSLDGDCVLTATWGGALRLWDTHTGQPLTLTFGHHATVHSAQFSPDGTRILTASSDKTAQVWDAQTGMPLIQGCKHANRVNSAQFSPDGKRIVTASQDKTARVWDAKTGQALTEPLKHNREVVSAFFSPDGKEVLTVSADDVLRVWDGQTSRLLNELPTDSQQPGLDMTRRQMTPEAYAGRMWDARAGLLLAEPRWLSEDLLAAQIRLDGQRLAALPGDMMRVWRVHAVRRFGLASAQFSPDGLRIVSTSADAARIWDADIGKVLTEPIRHSEPIVSARLSPDGTRLVTASWDDTAQMWDTQAGLLLTEPLKHEGWVRSAHFSPNGKRIVTASDDFSARVWEARSSQQVIETLKHSGRVTSAQFSPDGTRILTASDDKTAQIWDAQTGRALLGPFKHENTVGSAEFSPDGKRVVTASWDNTARVWDALTGLPASEPFKHTEAVTSAQFSPDGSRVLTVSQTGTQVWDVQTGQSVSKHTGAVTSAQFSPDGNLVVTASVDGTARVWDAFTGRPLSDPLIHSEGVSSAQFSPDGKRVVTAAYDDTARVWDAQTGKPLTEPLKHIEGVTCAHFSKDGKWVVTVASDSVRVWDSWSGEAVTDSLRHGNRVNSVEFSPDGTQLVSASEDCSARVWDIAPPPGRHPDWLLQLGEALCGEILSEQRFAQVSRADVIKRVRESLARAPADDDWVVWGRWITGDRVTRTISPFSKVTIRQWITNRIRVGTTNELMAARNVVNGTGNLLLRPQVEQALAV